MKSKNKLNSIYFTFHNVSIKTGIWRIVLSEDAPLHSTMFLLKRETTHEQSETGNIFTFHNVSIKTLRCKGTKLLFATLHSTMFLLKPEGCR